MNAVEFNDSLLFGADQIRDRIVYLSPVWFKLYIFLTFSLCSGVDQLIACIKVNTFYGNVCSSSKDRIGLYIQYIPTWPLPTPGVVNPLNTTREHEGMTIELKDRTVVLERLFTVAYLA